jgi:hypothetical protein
MTTHQPATTSAVTTTGTTTEAASAAAGRRGVWVAGLLVAAGAGVATAHGLYEVATAAGVAPMIGWLYPLITDGLALVGYAATSRLLPGGGRRYAAGIVVLAAGLSGLAQAVYLAGGISHPTSTATPVGLRFGVGAWPAIAAALTAHLLHLIGIRPPHQNAPREHALTRTAQPDPPAPAAGSAATYPPEPPVTAVGAVGVEPLPGGSVEPSASESVQPYNAAPVPPVFSPVAVQRLRTSSEPDRPSVQPARSAVPVQDGRSTEPVPSRPAEADRRGSGSAGGGARAGDRARDAARAHYARHGALPTVSELMRSADVARGTAGTVLKDLRADRPALQLVNADNQHDSQQ